MLRILLILLLPLSALGQEYSRKNWSHWLDLDRDCQNTRIEVLLYYTIGEVKHKQNNPCKRIISGSWYDPYTDQFFKEASDLDIDHRVSLKEAYEMGASKWTRAQKKLFANDMQNLIPVSKRANRSKGSRYAYQWMPPHREYWCDYINGREKVIVKYGLIAPMQEIDYNQRVKGKYCP